LDRSAPGGPVDEQLVVASHTPPAPAGGSRTGLAALFVAGLLLGCTMPNSAYSPVPPDGGGLGGGGQAGPSDTAPPGDAPGDDVRVIDVRGEGDLAGSGGGGAAPPDTAALEDLAAGDLGVGDVTAFIDVAIPGSGGAGGADAGSPADAPRVVDAVGPGTLGLVLHWRLDESGGTVAQDSSGRGLHGTYQGSPLPAPDSQAAPTGFANPNSRRFVAAANDVVRLEGSPAALQPSTGLTVSVWFRTSAVARADLVCYGADYFIRLENGMIGFVRRRPPGSSTTLLTAAGAAPTATDGAWHHAIGVADATGTRIWMDGKRIDSDGTSLPFTYTAGVAFTAGRSSTGFQPFEGALDDVRVYNRALTDSEITALALGAD
jgi:hypothetical protein